MGGFFVDNSHNYSLSYQIPLCLTKISSLSDLSAYMERNKHKPNKLIVIQIYSHKSGETGKVEVMKKRIIKEMRHAIFLDADLDDDWTVDLFWNANDRKRSNYWFIFMSETPEYLKTIHDLSSQWGISALGYFEGSKWVFGGYSGKVYPSGYTIHVYGIGI